MSGPLSGARLSPVIFQVRIGVPSIEPLIDDNGLGLVKLCQRP